MVDAGRKVSDVTTSTSADGAGLGRDASSEPARSDPLARMRREYAGELLEEALAPDWVTQFGRWLADAVSLSAAGGLPEPNAMVLATADARGRPSARTVLLKGYDERGFAFFTNYGSRKGTELRSNPYASLVFPWIALFRQVVVCGAVEPVERRETEAYFAVRPYGSQVGAWASPQSTVIGSRAVLDEAWARTSERYPDPADVPAPPHWGGFRVVPESVEFWQGRPSRMHDRLRYRRAEGDWIVERLAP
jgi:pyridoxamine 5'-phosphate oxidase